MRVCSWSRGLLSIDPPGSNNVEWVESNRASAAPQLISTLRKYMSMVVAVELYTLLIAFGTAIVCISSLLAINHSFLKGGTV